jgi:hypothetical protein
MMSHERTIRGLAVPLAMVGMAIAAPEGLAVAAPLAGDLVGQTVTRAEAITGQITKTLRDLCGSPDLMPAADRSCPAAPLCGADRAFAPIAPPPAATTAARKTLPFALIDLPPPTCR